MAPRGRPPKPLEQKRATGNPGKRTLPDKNETAALLALPTRSPIPAHLQEDGAGLYAMVLAACDGWLAQSDQFILLSLADAADRRVRLLEQLRNEGEVLYKSGPKIGDAPIAYAHPAAATLASLEKQMQGWASDLALNPVARSKLGLAEVKTVSKLDQLRKARDAR